MIVEKFKTKLKADGRTFAWWIRRNFPNYHYQSIMAQINGFATMQDYLKEAIKKYLAEE